MQWCVPWCTGSKQTRTNIQHQHPRSLRTSISDTFNDNIDEFINNHFQQDNGTLARTRWPLESRSAKARERGRKCPPSVPGCLSEQQKGPRCSRVCLYVSLLALSFRNKKVFQSFGAKGASSVIKGARKGSDRDRATKPSTPFNQLAFIT